MTLETLQVPPSILHALQMGSITIEMKSLAPHGPDVSTGYSETVSWNSEKDCNRNDLSKNVL